MSHTGPWRIQILGARVLLDPVRMAVCTAVLVLTGLCACSILMTGRVELDVAELLQALISDNDTAASRMLRELRLPRVVTGMAAGACLGLSGLVFQTLSRNALGSPELIGTVTGAALGAVTGIVIFGSYGWTTTAWAIGGAIVATAVGYFLTSRARGSAMRFVLVGIGLSSWWSAMTTLLWTRSDAELGSTAAMWLAGTLNARTWEHAHLAAAGLLVLLPVAIVLSRHLAVLDLGPDVASVLGVRLSVVGRVGICLGAALSAVAVAATGPISFVALAAPHIARSLGGRSTPPVCLSAACGAALLLGAELLVTHVRTEIQAPVSVVTGLLGGVYLLIMMLRSSR